MLRSPPQGCVPRVLSSKKLIQFLSGRRWTLGPDDAAQSFTVAGPRGSIGAKFPLSTAEHLFAGQRFGERYMWHAMPRAVVAAAASPPARFAHGLRATASSSRLRTRVQNLDDVEVSASSVAGDLSISRGEARNSAPVDRNSPFRLQGKASSMSSMSPVSPNIEPGAFGLGVEESNEVVYEHRSLAKTLCGIGPRTKNSQGEGEPEEGRDGCMWA